jgi:hypothetical protein
VVKLFLDDWREPPPDYILVRSVNELKKLVKRFGPQIEVLDLDNHLGPYQSLGGTGLDFIKWLEEAVYLGEVELNPDVKIVSHSSDPLARELIEEVGASIKAYLRSRR